MGIQKSGLPTHEVDLVKRDILQDAAAFHFHHLALVVHEVVDGEIFLERIVDAVEAALFQAREIKRGCAKGLAGNGAGVDATAAHVFGALDDGHALAEIGCLRATFFTGGSATDNDQIESIARSHESLRGVATCGPTVPEDCRRTAGQVEKFLVCEYLMGSGSCK